mgnify:CR=1 FL=1
MNSIFVEDSKYHLSINIETGLWQDFKAQEQGNFVQLVAFVESISYQDAAKFLRKSLLDTPEALFDVSTVYENNSFIVGEGDLDSVLKDFKPLKRGDIGSWKDKLLYVRAFRFIDSRKLNPFKFLLCETGKYANRIIIPYRSWDSEKIFYFQARNLSTYGMKYLNPSTAETGIKSSEILFPYDESKSYVILTEGPLDAMSLQFAGWNATCAQGSKLSNEQAKAFTNKTVIFGFDNDKVGMEATDKAKRVCLSKGVSTKELYSVKPPKEYKDWNEFYIGSNKDYFSSYVSDHLHPMDLSYYVNEGLSSVQQD